MSLTEWRALVAAKSVRAPALARRDLEDLMQHYPD
jgi:hypothetical protein